MDKAFLTYDAGLVVVKLSEGTQVFRFEDFEDRVRDLQGSHQVQVVYSTFPFDLHAQVREALASY